jgi:HSP20 family protein
MKIFKLPGLGVVVEHKLLLMQMFEEPKFSKTRNEVKQMANLAGRDTFVNDLFDFRRDLNSVFSRLVTGATPAGEHALKMIAAIPPVEAWVDKNEKKYHLSFALAGVDPKDIQINVQGNNLTVSGEQKAEEKKKEADYHYQEFSYGRFERSITLPEGVDTEKLTAEYKNGVLEITAPMNANALPRKIEIKTLPAAAKGAAA